MRLFFLLLLWPACLSAQAPFQHFRLDDKLLGRIDYHVKSRPSAVPKPLLLWLSGSGCASIETVLRNPAGKCAKRTSCMLDADSLAAHYHFVMISKPGRAFADTFDAPDLEPERFEAHGDSLSNDGCGRDYNDRLTLSWRAEAAARVIEDVLRRFAVDPRRVIVAGHSEGAPVAAKTAVLNRKVTHVGYFSGPGLTQFYDFVVQNRKQALTGELTPEASQHNIDTLLRMVADIMAHPVSDRFRLGHSYKRWASFAEPPVDNLLKLDIPIFAVASTHDVATAVENADIIPLLFAQQGKTNLTWRTCVGCDHSYFVTYNWQPGQAPVQRMDDVFGWFFRWLADH